MGKLVGWNIFQLKNKKWALVNWDKVCKKIYLGGLSLHNLGKINNIMGVKIWWWWL
jgi:hypothetical protein